MTVHVDHLVKHYRVHHNEAGPAAGWEKGDFISYYVGAAMVSHLTNAWILWDWWLVFVSIALAAVLFVLAAVFWRFALRFYTGASS